MGPSVGVSADPVLDGVAGGVPEAADDAVDDPADAIGRGGPLLHQGLGGAQPVACGLELVPEGEDAAVIVGGIDRERGDHDEAAVPRAEGTDGEEPESVDRRDGHTFGEAEEELPERLTGGLHPQTTSASRAAASRST